MESAQDRYKKWGIALVIFLLILIPGEIFLLKQNKKSSNPIATTALQKGNTAVSKIEADGSILYFLDLEYDPTTNKMTKIASGNLQGHDIGLQSSPSISNELFNSKIEVISPSNQTITSGWITLSKDVITQANGKYRFRASVPSVSGATINIYSVNKEKLFEEKIQ